MPKDIKHIEDKKELKIPDGYFIEISTEYSRNYMLQNGKCFVKIYRSLDREESPPVEHAVNIGEFEINARGMTVTKFLEKIRENITEIVKSYNIIDDESWDEVNE